MFFGEKTGDIWRNRKRTVYISFGGLLLELSGEKTNLGLRKDTRVYFTLRKV